MGMIMDRVRRGKGTYITDRPTTLGPDTQATVVSGRRRDKAPPRPRSSSSIRNAFQEDGTLSLGRNMRGKLRSKRRDSPAPPPPRRDDDVDDDELSDLVATTKSFYMNDSKCESSLSLTRCNSKSSPSGTGQSSGSLAPFPRSSRLPSLFPRGSLVIPRKWYASRRSSSSASSHTSGPSRSSSPTSGRTNGSKPRRSVETPYDPDKHYYWLGSVKETVDKVERVYIALVHETLSWSDVSHLPTHPDDEIQVGVKTADVKLFTEALDRDLWGLIYVGDGKNEKGPLGWESLMTGLEQYVNHCPRTGHRSEVAWLHHIVATFRNAWAKNRRLDNLKRTTRGKPGIGQTAAAAAAAVAAADATAADATAVPPKAYSRPKSACGKLRAWPELQHALDEIQIDMDGQSTTVLDLWLGVTVEDTRRAVEAERVRRSRASRLDCS